MCSDVCRKASAAHFPLNPTWRQITLNPVCCSWNIDTPPKISLWGTLSRIWKSFLHVCNQHRIALDFRVHHFDRQGSVCHCHFHFLMTMRCLLHLVRCCRWTRTRADYSVSFAPLGRWSAAICHRSMTCPPTGPRGTYRTFWCCVHQDQNLTRTACFVSKSILLIDTTHSIEVSSTPFDSMHVALMHSFYG